MGGYTNVAVRDSSGNIVGYRSTTEQKYSEGTGDIKYTHEIVGENTPQQQTQQPRYDPNSAEAIAREVALTGGASDFRLNLIAEREIAARGGDASFIRYATDIYVEREALGSSYVPRRLNLTREEAAAGAGITPDTQQRYLRYDQDTHQIERLTAPPESIGVDPGIHKARGDFGGPILSPSGEYGGWKGGLTAAERARGLTGSQEIVQNAEMRIAGSRPSVYTDTARGAEDAVKAGALPKPFTSRNLAGDGAVGETKKVLRPSDVDLAIMSSPVGGTVVGKALVDVSDFWLGGRKYQYETTKPGTKSITTESGTPTVERTKIEGGELITTTTPFTTTTLSGSTREIKEVPIESGFESLQKQASDKLVSGIAGVTGTSPEAVRIGLKFQSEVSAEMANAMPTPLNLQRAAGTSELKAAVEKPLEAGAYYGAGIGFGVAFKGAGSAFKGAQRIAAPAFESEGARRVIPRTISTAGTFVLEQGPKALTAVYGVDVAARSTEGFSDFHPGSVVSKGTPIAIQEVIPLGAGFGTVARFGESMRGARAGYEDYRQMLSERTPQTITARLTSTEGQLAVGQAIPEKPTTLGYIRYEAQRSVPASVYEMSDYIGSSKGLARDIGNIPRRVGVGMDIARETVLETAPEYMYRGTSKIYQTQEYVAGQIPVYTTRFGQVLSGARGAVTLERPGLSLAEKPTSAIEPIYSRYFTAKINAPIRAEQALISSETKAWEIMQKAKTPGITLKSAWQERGYEIGWEGAPRYSYTIQRRPQTQFVSIGGPGGAGSIGDRIKPSVGGTSIKLETKPTFERISTKTVGGAKVSGLSQERPLKTTPTFGEMTRTARTIGQSTDFRGKPASGTMKPMGKRASVGSLVMTEKLPGMEQPSPKAQMAQPLNRFAIAPVNVEDVQSVVSAGMQELIRKPEVMPSTMEVSRKRDFETSVARAKLPKFDVSQYSGQMSKVLQETTGRSVSKGLSIVSSIDRMPDIRYDEDVRKRTDEKTTFETIPFLDTDVTRVTGSREILITDTIRDAKERQWRTSEWGGGLFPPLLGGGGAGGYRGSLGATRWSRTNLVATKEYLSKGFGGSDFSAPKTFGATPTKSRKSRRKKK